MKDISGIYPALLTPYKNEKIYEEGVKNLIEYLTKQGCKGLYVGGSTGEGFHLTMEERKELFTYVKKYSPSYFTLIAYVGFISTSEAVELANFVKELKYDAISSVPPYYYPFTFEEIKGYFVELATKSDMPLIIYNIPVRSGVSFSLDQMSSLLDIKGVVGMKYTASNLYELEQLKEDHPDKTIFFGSDEMLTSGLSMGADGGIGSTYNFLLPGYIAIYEAMKNNDYQKALSIQKKCNKIIRVFSHYPLFALMKPVMRYLGVDVGECKKPLTNLTNEEEKDLIDQLNKCDWNFTK